MSTHPILIMRCLEEKARLNRIRWWDVNLSLPLHVRRNRGKGGGKWSGHVTLALQPHNSDVVMGCVGRCC